MSDITKLTSKILQDADKRYEQAVQQAKTESRQQLELKKRQLEQQKEERLARFKREKQNELHLKVSDLHVKSRNKLLATKQQVLDGLFSEALNQMKHLPQSRFDQFVITSINKTKLKGKAELILGE